MKDLKEFIEVKIENPIKVQCNIDGVNDFVDLEKVYLKCFNKAQHQNITLLLRNQYKRMMVSNMSLLPDRKAVENSKDKQELTEQETIESIKQLLSICDGDQLIAFYGRFKEFLVNDITFKDDSFKQKVNGLDLGKLENDDLENIIASYVAVFFVFSWMK